MCCGTSRGTKRANEWGGAWGGSLPGGCWGHNRGAREFTPHTSVFPLNRSLLSRKHSAPAKARDGP